MKKLEKFLIAFSVIGILINLFSPGDGEEIILLGMSFLGLLYLIFGFALFNNIGFRDLFKKNSYVEINMRRIVLSAVFGISMFGIIYGILFHLLRLEGAFELLVLSLSVASFLFIILLVRFFYKRITIVAYFRLIVLRLIPYSLIGIIIIIEYIYKYYYN